MLYYINVDKKNHSLVILFNQLALQTDSDYFVN